jgi:hypothetical protein
MMPEVGQSVFTGPEEPRSIFCFSHPHDLQGLSLKPEAIVRITADSPYFSRLPARSKTPYP